MASKQPPQATKDTGAPIADTGVMVPAARALAAWNRALAKLFRLARAGPEPSPTATPGLRISSPNDPQEREADRIASQVMRMPAQVAGGRAAATIVQWKCA